MYLSVTFNDVNYFPHLSGHVAGDLQDACEVAVTTFLTTALVEDVREAIDAELKRLFGDQVESKAFAVRSSAAGEMEVEVEGLKIACFHFFIGA